MFLALPTRARGVRVRQGWADAVGPAPLPCQQAAPYLRQHNRCPAEVRRWRRPRPNSVGESAERESSIGGGAESPLRMSRKTYTSASNLFVLTDSRVPSTNRCVPPSTNQGDKPEAIKTHTQSGAAPPRNTTWRPLQTTIQKHVHADKPWYQAHRGVSS